MIREESYKHQKFGLIVLSKALDDICPRYSNEPPTLKKQLIDERIKLFRDNEKELDKEWINLETEASKAVRKFKKEKQAVLSQISLTLNTKRVAKRVKNFEEKKQNRLTYLNQKLTIETKKLNGEMSVLLPISKRYAQKKKKLERITKNINDKIRKSELRFNTFISNALKSDNSSIVAQRIALHENAWEKKWKSLKSQYLFLEEAHNNKRFEDDQIRLAIQGFVEETERIQHWCLVSQVSLKDCYREARERLALVKRKIPDIEAAYEKIEQGIWI